MAFGVIGNRQSQELLLLLAATACCHSQPFELEQFAPDSKLQDVAFGCSRLGGWEPHQRLPVAAHRALSRSVGQLQALDCAPSEGHGSVHVGRTPGTFRRKHQEREEPKS